jgi:hypothetical protein
VFTNSPPPLPRGTTLVSPASRRTPAAPAARAIDSTTRRTTSTGSPSSRMKPAVMQSGSAPPTAGSLTVPFTANSPMSPPGKNSGETTYESVVTARVAPATSNGAWSPEGLPKSQRGRWNGARSRFPDDR